MAEAEPCLHPQVAVNAEVKTFEDVGGSILEISGCCLACQEPIAFLGLPWAISTTRPCRDVDATTATLPIQFGARKDIFETGRGTCPVDVPHV